MLNGIIDFSDGIDFVDAVWTVAAIGATIILFLTARALVGPGPHDSLGDTEEEDFGDEVTLGPVKTRPARRQIVEWRGKGRVLAVDSEGRVFSGKVVGQSLKRKLGLKNEIWVQRQDNARRWVRCGLPKAI